MSVLDLDGAGPYQPPWWARGPHAQTILGHIAPSKFAMLSSRPRRTIALDDGDALAVHQIEGTSDVRVLLFHGLSGDVDADYMRAAAHELATSGHGVWAVNHRGCGSGRGLARRPYHSGRSDDVRAVLSASRTDSPHLLHIAVGFSISGNIVLLGASQNTSPQADGVLAVHPPIDLASAAHKLHEGPNRIYELRFVARLRRAARELERGGLVRARGPLRLFAPIVEFDDRFTAPVSGFANAAEYYERCSSAPRVEFISTPTIVLSSEDDPLVDINTLRGAHWSSCTELHIVPHGGHMAHLSRTGPWLAGAVRACVERIAQKSREQRSNANVASRR